MKIRFTAAVAALAIGMAGCSTPGAPAGSTAGSTAGQGGAKQVVTVWMYPVISDTAKSQAFWGDTEKAFEAANADVDLNIELQPWDNRDEKIATAIASGKGPNLVVLGPDQLPQYQATGGLASLKGAVEPDKAKYLPSALEAATVDGDIYAVPIYHTITTTVYNKKAFDEAGVTSLPKTWDEVKAAAPRLAEKGVAVMDYSGDPKVTLNLSFYPLLWQAGGTVFNADGTSVAFNSPEGKAALQFLVDLKGQGGIPADAATKSNKVEGGGLASGKIAMGYSLVKAEAAAMQTTLGAENVVVGEPLTGAEQVAFGLPGLLTRTTIKGDEASITKAAQYLGSPEVQVGLSEASGFFPARSDAELPAADATTKAFQDALEHAKAGEVNAKSRQVMAALAPHLQAALQGSATVDQALAAAEQEANAALKG